MQMAGMPGPMSFGPQMATFKVQPGVGMNLMKGQLVNGQVLGKMGNRMMLRVGQNVMQAETSAPLEVGMKLQFQVKGQTTEGTLNLQLLRAQSFTPMTSEDLAQTMTGMKLPLSEDNVKTAKGMLQSGLPLTKEGFTEMKEALAQLPRTLPTDTQAASFLKLSSLPMTPQNISTLSNFITTHPLIGAQLFEVQHEFRKLTSGKNEKLSRETMDMLAQVPGLLGEYILDGKGKTGKKNSRVPKKMAGQVGIEQMAPHFGDDEDWDLLRMLMAIRGKLSQENSEEEEALNKLFQLMAAVEENMTAQQLINTARKNDDLTYYYMQVPFRLGENELTAEIKIYYTTDFDQRKEVDDDNTRIEFSITSEHLGLLHFQVEIVHGIIHVDVGTEREEVRAFVEHYLPALMENIKKLSYTAGRSTSYVTNGEPVTPLPMRTQEFENLERVNITG